MNPSIRALAFLLPFMLLQACVASQPRKATPYQRNSTPRQPEANSRTVSSSAPTSSPSTRNIMAQASQLQNKGQLEAAAQILERGLRMAPKDASLWSHLAAIRLQQQQYAQAQTIARKSNNLAGTDSAIIQKNNTIIESALSQQRK